MASQHARIAQSDADALSPESGGSLTPAALAVTDLCIVVACNDDDKFARHVLASDLVGHLGVPVHVERGASSAGKAYNRGLDATTAPIVIFAHQDVYFPPDWEVRLADAVAALDRTDPDWALIAPFGMAADSGAYIGRVWSSSIGGMIGTEIDRPTPAQSFDELVIVLRRSSGLRFDEDLPNFHMYGTDIVQAALAAGKGAYVAPLPLVHNDNYKDQLRADFTGAYRFMRRKWRARLPIRTSVALITWHGVNFQLARLRWWWSDRKRLDLSVTADVDPRTYSAQCGWE